MFSQKCGVIAIVLCCIAVALIAGCTSTSGNLVATPTPQIVYVTVTVTPTPTAITTTPSPTLNLSPECSAVLANIDDDQKFMDYLTDYNIVSRFSYILTYGCDKAEAVRINQLLIKGPSPKTSSLINLRDHLISASTYCQFPDSASISRTREDFTETTNDIQDYQDILTGCQREIGTQTTPSQESSSTPSSNSISYSGSGDDLKSFTGGGGLIITGTYSGDSNFIVHITDSSGNIEEFVFNQVGTYSGKKIVNIPVGTHYLEVTADGPWKITITKSS